jgi:hypothetical protein
MVPDPPRDERIERTMRAGRFIDFYQPFGGGISDRDQALAIVSRARALLAESAPGVGITYSANYPQTVAIRDAYARGSGLTRIGGANQAAVMMELESLLEGPYADLRGKVRIVPITTLAFPGPPGPDRYEVVTTDLIHLEDLLREGWAILGWQNQLTKGTDAPYAIGGGVAGPLPISLKFLIQVTLKYYRLKYGE